MPVEGFKVDVEKAVGHQFSPSKVSCNRRDYILYALAVGVKEDELNYLYELSMSCRKKEAENQDNNAFINQMTDIYIHYY